MTSAWLRWRARSRAVATASWVFRVQRLGSRGIVVVLPHIRKVDNTLLNLRRPPDDSRSARSGLSCRRRRPGGTGGGGPGRRRCGPAPRAAARAAAARSSASSPVAGVVRCRSAGRGLRRAARSASRSSTRKSSSGGRGPGDSADARMPVGGGPSSSSAMTISASGGRGGRSAGAAAWSGSTSARLGAAPVPAGSDGRRQAPGRAVRALGQGQVVGGQQVLGRERRRAGPAAGPPGRGPRTTAPRRAPAGWVRRAGPAPAGRGASPTTGVEPVSNGAHSGAGSAGGAGGGGGRRHQGRRGGVSLPFGLLRLLRRLGGPQVFFKEAAATAGLHGAWPTAGWLRRARLGFDDGHRRRPVFFRHRPFRPSAPTPGAGGHHVGIGGGGGRAPAFL